DPSTLQASDLRRILLDFDVSTALPLVLYLELDTGLSDDDLQECLHILESFVARRVLTGEENKEYNKFFVEVIGSVRDASPTEVRERLLSKLLAGTDTSRVWPTDKQ